LSWLGKLILAVAGVALALIAWATLARQFAPKSNTALTRFDAIVVLGTSADADGNPTPYQLARVTEAVHEYERGVAPRLILTGAAVSNRFVEARVMAQAAHAEGIPDSAIIVEPQARNTIENACYAVRIMKAHGWHSAEVVSSAAHLPRAAIIFSRLPLEWRIDPAPPLSADSAGFSPTAVEILKTVHYLIWSKWTDRCEP
jgi:uncharacterized SAM-binding protein YcdF (DUF218 family)